MSTGDSSPGATAPYLISSLDALSIGAGPCWCSLVGAPAGASAFPVPLLRPLHSSAVGGVWWDGALGAALWANGAGDRDRQQTDESRGKRERRDPGKCQDAAAERCAERAANVDARSVETQRDRGHRGNQREQAMLLGHDRDAHAQAEHEQRDERPDLRRPRHGERRRADGDPARAQDEREAGATPPDESWHGRGAQDLSASVGERRHHDERAGGVQDGREVREDEKARHQHGDGATQDAQHTRIREHPHAVAQAGRRSVDGWQEANSEARERGERDEDPHGSAPSPDLANEDAERQSRHQRQRTPTRDNGQRAGTLRVVAEQPGSAVRVGLVGGGAESSDDATTRHRQEIRPGGLQHDADDEHRHPARQQRSAIPAPGQRGNDG